MKTIYQSTITEIGEQVDLFLQEKMLILFNETAPRDLRDIAVVHKSCSLEDNIEVGDEFVIEGQVFKVSFVGDKVNETMRDLGHSTIAFNGALEADLPGTICVEDKEIPTMTVSSQIMFRKPSREA